MARNFDAELRALEQEQSDIQYQIARDRDPSSNFINSDTQKKLHNLFQRIKLVERDQQFAAQQAAQQASNDEEDRQVGSAGQFVGYDASGNAIYNNNGQYQAFNKNDFAHTHARLARDKANAGKSFEDYQGQQQAAAMGEFQGFDKETGAAVFNRDGQFTGADKSNFSNLYNYLQKTNKDKTWFNPEYEKQFNAAQQGGVKFQGVDAEGKVITKDALGHYGTAEATSGYAKFVKEKKANEAFGGYKGESNVTAGENVNTTTPAAGQQRAIASNAQSDISKRMPFQGKTNQSGYAKFAASQAPPPGAPAQQTSTPSAGAPPASVSGVKEQTIPKEPAKVPTTQTITGSSISGTPKTSPTSPNAPTPLTNVFKQPSMFDVAKDTAKEPIKQEVQSGLNSATQSFSQQSGIDQEAITNPAAYARRMALQQASQQTGMDNQILINPADYARQQAAEAIGEQYGIDKNLLLDPAAYARQKALEAASNQAGIPLNLNMFTDPKQYAVDQANKYLEDQIGFNPAEALRNPLEYAKKQAEEQAKKQARDAAVNYISSGAGVDGGIVNGAIDIGNAFSKGGVNEESSDAAARAAAQMALQVALTPFLGPAAAFVNPEAFKAAGYGAGKGIEELGGGKDVSRATSGVANLGAANLGVGLDVAGGLGSSTYNLADKGVGSLKMLAKGDAIGAMGSAGKALANFAIGNGVKAPVQAVKKVYQSVKNFVADLCLDGDTEILMENDKYKKLKTIKIGDRIALGGKVTGIGSSYTKDLYEYNGVYVSGGHAVFEDGVWKRVFTSDNAENLNIKKDAIVYPMTTENHLIVTKGQVWSDLTEVSDTHNKTEDERIAELNGQRQINKMLRIYVKLKFVQKD